MYVEVLDHARHDGGGLGRAIGFSRQDTFRGLPAEHVFLVGSYSRCLLIHFVYFYTVDSRKIELLIDYFFRKNKIQEVFFFFLNSRRAILNLVSSVL